MSFRTANISQVKAKRSANLKRQKERENMLLASVKSTRNMASNQKLFINSQRTFLNIVNKSIQELKNVNSESLPTNVRQKIGRSITNLSVQKNKSSRLVQAYNAQKK